MKRISTYLRSVWLRHALKKNSPGLNCNGAWPCMFVYRRRGPGSGGDAWNRAGGLGRCYSTHMTITTRPLCHSACHLRQNKGDDLKESLAHNSLFSFKSFEDFLFDALGEDNDHISLPRFLNDLRRTGLRLDDPRIAESMQKFADIKRVLQGQDIRQAMVLDRESFKECVKDNIVLIHRAFTSDFVIPDFRTFTDMIDHIYWASKSNTNGKVADYIPQLARFSPDYWGVSVCTIDGQRHSIGDTTMPFCLQSCSKPLTYALVLNDLGPDVVHQYIGQEPSGEVFNEIKLDHKGKPHNPMINAGAIVVTSLVKNDMKLADRFDYLSNQYRKLAGGEFLGFNNAVFLSERETADRNFALGYYMKENKCFPDGTHLMETLDFYFQLCSVETTCESGAVMAATLANGGICPITGNRVLGAEAVRNTLSLMYSCGMYDYSGQFAFTVGLPAKSGVSGAILLVVPNVMGICLWSPPLDETGNSVRGIDFSKELVNTFNFHNYDNLKYTPQKLDPRLRKVDQKGQEIMLLLFGASNGDLTALRRLACLGVDMGMADYDGRTALHLAAAEGHLECIKFLLYKCHVDLNPRDRWDHTPLGDAERFEHTASADFLRMFSKEHLANIKAVGAETTSAENHAEAASKDEPPEAANADKQAEAKAANAENPTETNADKPTDR